MDHIISCYLEWKEQVLYPDLRLKKTASLTYQIENVFTYFQEASGITVEYFWKHISLAGLDYVRDNKPEKILTRGKIRGRIEYEYVSHMIIVAEQPGLITPGQSQKLRSLMGEFELKSNKKSSASGKM